jgi:3-hydroxyacyl-[acyl-carrier-protein] dehydratase
MIPEHFYTLIKAEEITPSQSYIFSIILNADHPLYEGHFPQQPIVPGVLMIALVKDLVEIQLKKKLQLAKARNIKYLNILIPTKDQQISVDVQIDRSNPESIVAIGSIKHSETVYCKYKLEFIEPVMR